MPLATATDGTRLYFEEAGDGPPVLFIHEFAGDWRAWAPQVSHFSRRRRCIVYSARGYPGSDRPEDVESYSQDIARSDALAVLDHLGIESAILAGMSQGGFLSLRCALTKNFGSIVFGSLLIAIIQFIRIIFQCVHRCRLRAVPVACSSHALLTCPDTSRTR